MYSKGGGAVILINGEFGRALYSVNSANVKASYFAAADSTTWGVTKYSVSKTAITAHYLRSDGGGFADSFTIQDAASATATPTAVICVPTVYAADTFSRDVADGWKSADVGGAYTLTGTAAGFDVTGSAGTILLPAKGTNRVAVLPSVSAQDVDLTFRVQTDKAATGSGFYAYGLARRVNTNTHYEGQVRFGPTGQIAVRTSRFVAGAATALGTEAVVPGVTHTPGSFVWVRMQVVGTNPTTIRVKAWADGQAEPVTWSVTRTDSTASLQAPGNVGLRAYMSSASTNAPVVFTFDDYRVTRVQP